MRPCTLLLCFFLGVLSVDAKILVVVDSSYYRADSARVNRYLGDMTSIQGFAWDLQLFKTGIGKDRTQCLPLWRRIRDRYVQSRTTNDTIKGCVLIGALPVPMGLDAWPGGSLVPCDWYYMDVFDRNANAGYASDNIWQWYPDSTGFTGYGWPGDYTYDLWVSRVTGKYFSTDAVIRGRSGAPIGTNEIVGEYLDRVHARMTSPSRVPSRGFVMGEITDSAWSPVLGRNLDLLRIDSLRLSQYFEFRFPQNNPANWQSQLQAGPRGNTNYGGYNCMRSSTGRNVRNCVYGSLTDPRTGTVYSGSNLDTMGYEWAGIFEHSNPFAHDFNRFDVGGARNGTFYHQKQEPMVDSSSLVADPNSYRGKYYRYTYRNSSFGWGMGGKDPRFKTPAFSVAGSYDAYAYYVASNRNDDSLYIGIYSVASNDSFHVSQLWSSALINFQVHTNPSPGAIGAWELLARVTFTAGSCAEVQFVQGVNGLNTAHDMVADAVRFVGVNGTSTAGITVVVDDADPTFKFSDWQCRSFHDMRDEDTVTHGAVSKVPFYLSKGCSTNDFTYSRFNTFNTLGLSYAMLHNGLICMGGATSLEGGLDYWPYISTIRDTTRTFGDAFLSQANSSAYWYGGPFEFHNIVELLGTGTLRAKPYVPYGDYSLTGQTISNKRDLSNVNSITMTNTTVASTGKLDVQSDRTISIRPETRLAQGSEVRLHM
jgi:hypothetical protein